MTPLELEFARLAAVLAGMLVLATVIYLVGLRMLGPQDEE